MGELPTPAGTPRAGRPPNRRCLLVVEPGEKPFAPVGHVPGKRSIRSEKSVVGQPRVGTGAGPTVGEGIEDQARANGVQFYVSHGGPQVGVVERSREESVSPKMSGPPMLTIEPAGVDAVRQTDRPGERVRTAAAHDEMHVVGHEAIRPNTQLVAASVFGDHVSVEGAVSLRKEDVVPAIPFVRDVVGAIVDGNSSDPWHRKTRRRLGTERILGRTRSGAPAPRAISIAVRQRGQPPPVPVATNK